MDQHEYVNSSHCNSCNAEYCRQRRRGNNLGSVQKKHYCDKCLMLKLTRNGCIYCASTRKHENYIKNKEKYKYLYKKWRERNQERNRLNNRKQKYNHRYGKTVGPVMLALEVLRKHMTKELK